MTLPGTTASRFLLAAARVVLTNDQFSNGYLPDFRGNKAGRVPIPQESVDKLKGMNTFSLLFSLHLIVVLWQKLLRCDLVIEKKIWEVYGRQFELASFKKSLMFEKVTKEKVKVYSNVDPKNKQIPHQANKIMRLIWIELMITSNWVQCDQR